MNIQHWLLAILWLSFGLLHSLLAATFLKRYLQKLLGNYYTYYRIVYSLFALITLLYVLYYQFSIASLYVFAPALIIKIIASLTMVFAALIMSYCIYQYFLPLSGVGILINKNLKPDLKTNGLNKYIRHPLYLGTLLMLWSLFLLFPLLSNLVACAAISIYTITGIYFEEQKLLKVFGNEYRAYQYKVPMLIPFSKARPS